jgi:hypothetical protein
LTTIIASPQHTKCGRAFSTNQLQNVLQITREKQMIYRFIALTYFSMINIKIHNASKTKLKDKKKIK